MDEAEKNEIGRLVKEITKGNAEAIGEIYERCGRVMYVIARIYLREEVDIQDTIQDALIKIVQKAKSYREGTNAYAWINKIVENTAKDRVKRDTKRQYIPIEKAQPTTEFDEDILIVNEAMQLLNEKERKIIRYYYWYGMTFEEIAKTMRKQKSTINYTFHEAINKLKKFFSE